MDKKNKKCPSSADGNHKPDPAFRRAGRENVALDEERGRLITEVLCVACGSAGTAEALISEITWAPEPHG